jgi:hypothetical protein
MKKGDKIKLDLINKKFSRLTVVGHAEGFLLYNRHGKFFVPGWTCVCDCGKSIRVQHYKLLSGHSKSCGCLRADTMSDNFKTHGYANKIREYKQWKGAKSRCNNKNNARYASYGARGIKFSIEWEDFAVFLKDMGSCPEGMSLGRIDNDGDYCKKNCRWETAEQQVNNKTNTIKIKHDGEILSLAQFARKHKVDYGKLKWRVVGKKMPIATALKELKTND